MSVRNVFKVIPILVKDCCGKVNIYTTIVPIIIVLGIVHIRPPNECTNRRCIFLYRNFATTNNRLDCLACASLAKRYEVILEIFVNENISEEFFILVLLDKSVTANSRYILANGCINGRKFILDRHCSRKVALGEEYSDRSSLLCHSSDKVLSYLQKYRSGNGSRNILETVQDIICVIGITDNLVKLSCKLARTLLQQGRSGSHILFKNCRLNLTAEHQRLLLVSESIECLVYSVVLLILVLERMKDFGYTNPLILIAIQVLGDITAVRQEVKNDSSLTTFETSILGLCRKANVSIGHCGYKSKYIGCGLEILLDRCCGFDRCFLNNEFTNQSNILFERNGIGKVLCIIGGCLDNGYNVLFILLGNRGLAGGKVRKDFH